jgi:hypothetical protein
MHRFLPLPVIALAFALSACGDTDLERGVTGAAIGAGAASLSGNDPIVGGAIGGGIGVLCDDVTPQLCK